ncbi:hypothetical protein FQR65_LT00463 [Abscondita terminalis]|nr:hypothetical protein FQR65_LT00463 [Abscondita terminalis]
MRSGFYFVLFTLIYETSCGFTSGAPCTVRNTALLETRGFWRIPRDANVQCVDVTSLGNNSDVPVFWGLMWATTLYADHMRLKTVPTCIIDKMPFVKLIDFSGNSLRTIGKDDFLPINSYKFYC